MAYNSKEPESSPERFDNFFRNLSLGDIYGKQKPNPSRIKISEEAYRRLTSQDRKTAWEEREKFVTEHNLYSIGSFESYRNEGYFVREGPTTTLTYWIPSYSERQLIFDLARSFNNKNKPFILEAACGSGLVSKLLAVENHAKVIGVDPYMNSAGSPHVPQVNADVQFLKQDIWDTVCSLGPKFEGEGQSKREKLLSYIREEYGKSPVFEHFSIGNFGTQIGDPSKLNSDIEMLQELSRTNREESPVDLVLCSFMPSTSDLTVPIRDGINPKCIVYVRPTNGMSGAGDFYMGEALDENLEEASLSPNSAISYNPGKYYQTAARWQTHQRNNWHYFQNPPGFGNVFDTEVVVQIREDVRLENRPSANIKKYGFDEDIEEAFEKIGNLEGFLIGIKMARKALFEKYH